MFANFKSTFTSALSSAILLLSTLLPLSSALADTELEPTVILISLDGVHPSYLDRYSAPTLNRLARAGLEAEYLQPIFPTKTFPNHYALVTGLHAENHGIVDNGIYDPASGRVFSMGKREEVESPFWWQGEPIWVTAEKQGVTAGTFFFPGSEAPIKGRQASYWLSYDGDIDNHARVDTVVEWLEKPAAERPRLITLYMSDVDSAGHRHGPSSPEVAIALREVDAAIGYLVAQLESRGLFSQIDLMVASDHGMARVDQSRHIVIDQQFDTSLAEHVRYSRELIGIFPRDGETDTILEQLEAGVDENAARIYRKSDMPDRFHYQEHERIPPIVIVAEEGWIFVRESWLDDMLTDDAYHQARGGHGYDNNEASMQAMFIAHGPSFYSEHQVGPLRMVDIYNVIAHILDLDPAPNDGNADVVPLLLKDSD